MIMGCSHSRPTILRIQIFVILLICFEIYFVKYELQLSQNNLLERNVVRYSACSLSGTLPIRRIGQQYFVIYLYIALVHVRDLFYNASHIGIIT